MDKVVNCFLRTIADWPSPRWQDVDGWVIVECSSVLNNGLVSVECSTLYNTNLLEISISVTFGFWGTGFPGFFDEFDVNDESVVINVFFYDF